mmetsp:Transcript_6615/g.24664  ORF Transcript_6615/g.24664 Transcript_6615/m.24664 type:complete len:700 (+) Transcript_6615:133-2232(+)
MPSSDEPRVLVGEHSADRAKRQGDAAPKEGGRGTTTVLGLIALLAAAIAGRHGESSFEDLRWPPGLARRAWEVAGSGSRAAEKEAEDATCRAHKNDTTSTKENVTALHRSFLDHFHRIDPRQFPRGSGASVGSSPPNVERVSTHYGRCECQQGLRNVTFWPDSRKDRAVTVGVNEVRWVKFDFTVRAFHYFCDGMYHYKSVDVNVAKSQWVSLQVNTKIKSGFFGFGFCEEESGMLHLNVWSPTSHVSSVPFTTSTDGYACIKIPALLRTGNGTMIAFAEARTPDCDDFSRTDLVFKRSTDGGKTWSKLQVLVKVDGDTSKMGVCGHELVIGNIAPVQLREDSPKHPGRILAPYTRNNFKVWIVHSDDDGETWTGDHEIANATNTLDEPDCSRGMDFFGFDVDTLRFDNVEPAVKFAALLCHTDGDSNTDPYKHWKDILAGPWQFVGVGPPGALQLKSGRVLVPAFHSFIRGIGGGKKNGHTVLPLSQLYNNFALGHAMISDDGGDTWHLGEEWAVGHGANENQMVQFKDGTVMTNSRALATGSRQQRLQSVSNDEGETFTASNFVEELPQPFNGCQGSTVTGDNDEVYVSTPDPPKAMSVLAKIGHMLGCTDHFTGRRKVTIWKSTDKGKSYPHKFVVDEGLSAQSSLQHHDGGKMVLLYEQVDPEPQYSASDVVLEYIAGDVKVLLPSRFVFREVEF